jgi:hypothetical protein
MFKIIEGKGKILESEDEERSMVQSMGLQPAAREALPSGPRNKSRPPTWFFNKNTMK